MKPPAPLLRAIAIVTMASAVHAAPYYLQHDMTTTNGETLATTTPWFSQLGTGGTNPSTLAGHSFFTSGYSARTATGNNTFGGSTTSLTLNGGSIGIRTAPPNLTTIPSLQTSGLGGALSAAVTSANVSVTSLNAAAGTKLNTSLADRTLNVSFGTLTGSGGISLTGGGIVKLSASSANAYTGTVTWGDSLNTILDFESTLISGGSLVVPSSSRIKLDQNVTFVSATISGVPLSAGTHSFSSLNSTFNANFIDGGSGSITVGGAPAQAGVINLSSSHNFPAPGNITASAASSLPGLTSFSSYQAMPVTNRFVYTFETWPQAIADLGTTAYTFSFDLSGDGTSDQTVSIETFLGTDASNLKRSSLSSASSPGYVLDGLRGIGWNAPEYHTLTFQKPVSAVGRFTARPPRQIRMQ